MNEEALNARIADLEARVKILTGENGQLLRQRDWARDYIMKGIPMNAVADRAFMQEMWEAGPGNQLAELIAELEAESHRKGPPGSPLDPPA